MICLSGIMFFKAKKEKKKLKKNKKSSLEACRARLSKSRFDS